MTAGQSQAKNILPRYFLAHTFAHRSASVVSPKMFGLLSLMLVLAMNLLKLFAMLEKVLILGCHSGIHYFLWISAKSMRE